MADNKVEFINIKVSEIAPNPEQPRKFFSEEAQDELTNSIKENGLLQPVVVRPVEGAKVPYMLIAGERRWRSCQAAGLEVIPAKVVEGATEEEAYVLSIADWLFSIRVRGRSSLEHGAGSGEVSGARA